MDRRGMRNIAHKVDTLREATAESAIKMQPETMQLLREGRAPKGDPLPHARVAAIMGAKRTSDLIPYCHPLLIDCVTVDYEFDADTLRILVTVTAVAKTGVEMEAMTGASLAALTIYDMMKPVDKTMEILTCRLNSKKGGKSSYPAGAPEGLRAAVLVISDSTASGLRDDTSGKLICDRLKDWGMQECRLDIVPDDAEAIVQRLIGYANDNFQLVLTTGGTGLSPRDVTTEATRRVVDREAPGIAEALRSYGQRRTPYAMLSQGIAGLRGQTLIVNLPGSTGGVDDAMTALFPALFHAFAVMEGAGH